MGKGIFEIAGMRQRRLAVSLCCLLGAGALLLDVLPSHAQANSTSRTGTQSPFRKPSNTKKAHSRKPSQHKKAVVLKSYPKYTTRRDLYGSDGAGYVPKKQDIRGARGF